MKVVVDPERCQGHGRCYDLAPDVFAADDDGYATLLAPDGEVAPEHEAQARAAAANCPERAITSTEPDECAVGGSGFRNLTPPVRANAVRRRRGARW